MIAYIALLVFPFVLIVAAIMDLFTLTIPNRLCLVLAAGFVLAALLTGLPVTVVTVHLVTGVAVLALGFALFHFGIFGGGDAKLLAAVALWVGFGDFPAYLMLVAAAGGVLSVAIILYRSVPAPLALLRFEWAVRLHDKKTGIPYGIAIAAAGLWVFPGTAWFTALI